MAGISHSALLPGSVISRAPDLLSTVVDGELVLMSIHLGNYYGVAASARRIWEMLENPRSLDQLVEELGREFEGDADVMRADIGSFIESLRKQGLVTVR